MAAQSYLESTTAPSQIEPLPWTLDFFGSKPSQRGLRFLNSATTLEYKDSNLKLIFEINRTAPINLRKSNGRLMSMFNTDLYKRPSVKITNISFEHEISEEEIERLSKTLVLSIVNADEESIETFKRNVSAKLYTSEMLSAVCDELGRLSEQDHKEKSLYILTHLLSSPIAQVRDDAVTGLALLDDMRSLPALEQSLEIEKNSFLKLVIAKAIAQISK